MRFAAIWWRLPWLGGHTPSNGLKTERNDIYGVFPNNMMNQPVCLHRPDRSFPGFRGHSGINGGETYLFRVLAERGPRIIGNLFNING